MRVRLSCATGALKARRSKAQGEAAKRPKPWVGDDEIDALKGRRRQNLHRNYDKAGLTVK